jgi:hypothetical protein
MNHRLVLQTYGITNFENVISSKEIYLKPINAIIPTKTTNCLPYET